MIEEKASGKLFVAGEYAVVEPGHTAILVAVNKFIKVRLRPSREARIKSRGRTLKLTRREGRLLPQEEDPSFRYIISAIHIVEAYALELGRELDFYYLEIESQLEAKDGRKYGLGSSGAIVVATIKALCRHYKIDLSQEDLFKLSALANLLINKNSSCGDIASIVYGGWIAYTSFNREWVLEKYKSLALEDLISLDWPSLKIQPLTPPKGMEVVIGWTGRPASTINLVAKIKRQKGKNKGYYERFLLESEKCVKNIVAAFKARDIKKIQDLLVLNRKLLVSLGERLNVSLETPKLKKLYSLGLKYQAYGKFSGAGGGDCGIVILSKLENKHRLIREWEMSGIKYLPLKVHNLSNSSS